MTAKDENDVASDFVRFHSLTTGGSDSKKRNFRSVSSLILSRYSLVWLRDLYT